MDSCPTRRLAERPGSGSPRLAAGRRPVPLSVAGILLAAASALAQTQPTELLPGHEVRYVARDQLTAWVGRAPLAELTLELDTGDLRRSRLRAVVHPADFDSGVAFRDATGRRTVFASDEHPEAVFELLAVAGEALDLPEPSDRTLRATGTLEIRGVRREIEADVTLARRGDEVDVRATFAVSLEAFGLSAPRFLMLVAEDHVAVEVEARLRLLPGSTTTTR
jgi:polyisoprenoid-binding protein YceI